MNKKNNYTTFKNLSLSSHVLLLHVPVSDATTVTKLSHLVNANESRIQKLKLNFIKNRLFKGNLNNLFCSSTYVLSAPERSLKSLVAGVLKIRSVYPLVLVVKGNVFNFNKLKLLMNNFPNKLSFSKIHFFNYKLFNKLFKNPCFKFILIIKHYAHFASTKQKL